MKLPEAMFAEIMKHWDKTFKLVAEFMNMSQDWTAQAHLAESLTTVTRELESFARNQFGIDIPTRRKRS